MEELIIKILPLQVNSFIYGLIIGFISAYIFMILYQITMNSWISK